MLEKQFPISKQLLVVWLKGLGGGWEGGVLNSQSANKGLKGTISSDGPAIRNDPERVRNLFNNRIDFSKITGRFAQRNQMRVVILWFKNGEITAS